MFVTEHVTTNESKFKKFDNQPSLRELSSPVNAQGSNIKQIIRQLELKVNIESPRTQKAMNNLGLTKFNLTRQNIADFKGRTPEEQNEKYKQHLNVYKDNLKAVISERQTIKRWLAQRKREEDQFLGISQPRVISNGNIKPDIEPIGPKEIQEKIEKDQQRALSRVEQETKKALLQELQRRAKEAEMQQKFQIIETKKHELIQLRRDHVKEFNERANQVMSQQKKTIHQQMKEKFKLSETFYDKFAERDYRVLESRQKSLDNIARRNRDNFERIINKKHQIMQLEDDTEQLRINKDIEVQKRIQLRKDSQAMQRRQKKEEIEENIQNVVKNAKEYQQSVNLVSIEKFLNKMEKRNTIQLKQQNFIQKSLTDHKKIFHERFSRQKQRLKQMQDHDEEEVKERKEKFLQEQERIKQFEEQKALEHSLKVDVSQQKFIKKSEAHQDHLKIQLQKEDELLQKSLKLTNKLQQRKQEYDKILQYQTQSRLQYEQQQNKYLSQAESIQNIAVSQLLEKFQSMPNLSKEDLDFIKKNFQDGQVKTSTAHKSQRSASQQFFKKQ